MNTPDMFREVCGVLEPRYPKVPGNKASAPETSRVAAIAIKPDAHSLRSAVLKVLRTGNYTSDEVAEKLGESILAIRPRCSELVALARITDSGIRRKNASGRFAVVLRIA